MINPAINVYAFRNRFPDLVDAKDDEIQNMIDFAISFHDESMWSERDYGLAVLLWSAHMLALYKTQQANILSEGGVSADLYVGSLSFAERSVSYGQRAGFAAVAAAAGPGEAQLGNTLWGQMYIQVRRRNIIPVAIV